MAERGSLLGSPETRVCEIMLPVIVFELSDDDFLESEDEEQTALEENPFCLPPEKAEIVKDGRGAESIDEDCLHEGALRVTETEKQATPFKVMKNEGVDEEVPGTCEGLNAVSFQTAVDQSEPDQNRVLDFFDLTRQNRTENEDGEISDLGDDHGRDQRTLASLNTQHKGESSVTDSVIKMTATGSQETHHVASQLAQESLPELPSVDPGRSVNDEGTGHNDTCRNPQKSSEFNEEPCQSNKSEEYPYAADQNEQSASPLVNGNCLPGAFPEDVAKTTDGWKCLLCNFEDTSSACLKKHICPVHENKNNHKITQRSSFVSSERCCKFIKKRNALKGRTGRSDPGEDGWHEDELAGEKKKTNKYEKFFYKMKAAEPSESFCCKTCSSPFLDSKDFSQHVKEHNNGPPYQCPQCEYSSDDESYFLNHLYWHAGHDLYQCNFCTFISRHSNSMVKHSCLHTGAKPYLCAICQQGFTSARGLSRHAGTHCQKQKSSLQVASKKDVRPPKICVCEVCNIVFYSQTLLQSHQKCHVQEKGYNVSSGDVKNYQRQGTACKQEESSHKEKTNRPDNAAGKKSDGVQCMYNCDRCNLAFRKEEHLVYHQAIHAEVPPGENITCNDQQSGGNRGLTEAHPAGQPAPKLFKCLQCDYTTFLFSNLRVHFATHTGEKPFKCQECGKSFRNSSHLKRHSLLHVLNRHRCSWCLYTGSTADDLKLHEETCKDKGSAGKRFHPSTLKYESSGEQTDTGEADRSTPSQESGARSYKCEHCAYSTSSSDNLKTHARIHTDEKPYTCKVCRKIFQTSSNLRQHASVHQELKFNCSCCDYSTSTQQSYRQHLASHREVHRQEKPPLPVKIHKCEKCSYSTIRKDNLKIHFRIHTGERPYKCRQCDHAFCTSSHLKKHLLTHLKLQCDT